MAIRITGMNSGLDTESIIRELVKAKSANVEKAKKQKTSLEWKQDAWKELNKKLLKFRNGVAGNLRWQSAYMKKTSTASNKNAVDIITGKDAVDGVQNMKINRLAKTGYLTGAALSEDGKFTADTKLSELAPEQFGNPDGSGTVSITVAGKTKDIHLTSDTTLGDIANKLKEAGVNANFDVKSQRFFISAKKSGSKNDFSITASDAAGQKALEKMGIQTSLATDEITMQQYREYASYYVAGDRNATLEKMQALIDAMTADRAAAYRKDNEEIEKSLKEYSDKIEANKKNADYPADGATAEELNTRLTETKDQIKALQDEIKGMEDGADKTAKEKELKELQESAKKLETQHKLVGEVEDFEAKSQKLNERKAVNDSYINPDGTAKDKLTDEVKESYYAKAEYASDILKQYEQGTLPESGATRIQAQDAQITLNGAVFDSETNVFEINGLTFTALQETEEEFSVTTQNDTAGIYDMVKNFVKEYNSLIGELDKLYNAASSKGYEPLTDDEKEEMTDKEIEKWEEKIKNSILRRDENISSVGSAMKQIMSAGVEIDGKQMYLSDFGIDMLGYFEAADNEKYMYHLDGDPDDEISGGKPDKLKGLIASEPEKVAEFFSTLSQNLYQKMTELSKSSDYRSYNMFYDDKKMKHDFNDYTSKIANLEKKLAACEDKYYRQFSKMETALARMQSSQNAITGLLGG